VVGLFAFIHMAMNYSRMSKKNLAVNFASMDKNKQKKMLLHFLVRHKASDEEKSPFEMMGTDVQKMVMGLWLQEVVDDPSGKISQELLKRAPESKKRAQVNIDNTHRLDPAMATAKALLKDSSQDDLRKIVGGRMNGKRPVKSIEDADYIVIEE